MELNLVSRAIVEYFQGERSEMIVIISTSIMLAALVAWLLFLFKDSFTKGLADCYRGLFAIGFDCSFSSYKG